ncbi:MAG: hypothetical protein G8237_08285 [Magnetococcales bacterium]|nr:hypothetical protein [Magnetococcales bacterium]
MQRFFLWIMVGITVMLLILVAHNESDHLEITRHRIGPVGSGRPGVRIAQISDLHILGAADVEEQVLERVRAEDPDLIVLTGDMVDHREKRYSLWRFLDQLPLRARKVAVPGNWEYWARIKMEKLRRHYEQHGVTLLINETMWFGQEGHDRLLIVGLDDERHGQPDWQQAMQNHAEWDGAVLVLAHNPVTLVNLHSVVRNERLMLAGHTHGGQILLFGRWWQREQPCRAGWCPDSPSRTYVTRGIGTIGIPLRIGSRPELALFEWRW